MPATQAQSSVEPSEANKSRAADQALPVSAPGDFSDCAVSKSTYSRGDDDLVTAKSHLREATCSFEQLTLQLEAAARRHDDVQSLACSDCGSVHDDADRSKTLCLKCGSGTLRNDDPSPAEDPDARSPSPRRIRLSTDAANFIQRKLSEARMAAALRGAMLLLDQLECELCGSCGVVLALPYAHWQCEACGSQVSGLQVRAAEAEVLPVQTMTAEPIQIKSSAGQVKIFDKAQLLSAAAMAVMQHADSESISRVTKMIDRLIESGVERELGLPPFDWRDQLDSLLEEFPNFAAVIRDVLRPTLAISAAGGVSRPPPLLLLGEPGVGKSHFCSLYAKILAVPFVSMDMSSATTGASLCGLSVHWSNAGPGEVLKTLAFGREGKPAAANPVFFLDEVDKVAADQRFDPLSGLYGLLESEGAKRFEDQSFPGLTMDASHIQWLLAANSVESIPKPLLNRMHVIEIQRPNNDEKVKMFTRIYESLAKATRLKALSHELDCAIAHALLEYNPRQFKLLVGIAIGRAVESRRWHVTQEDFAVQKLPAIKAIGF